MEALIFPALGFLAGFVYGWRACVRHHVLTVTAVKGETTITIDSASGVAVGDRLWVSR